VERSNSLTSVGYFRVKAVKTGMGGYGLSDTKMVLFDVCLLTH